MRPIGLTADDTSWYDIHHGHADENLKRIDNYKEVKEALEALCLSLEHQSHFESLDL